MALNMSPDIMGRLLDAFKQMGVDDRLVGQALKQAAQQPSRFRLHIAAQAGASKFASKFARKAVTKNELKDRTQKAQKTSRSDGKRIAVGSVDKLAVDFEKASGSKLKQWQLKALFESLEQDETAESLAAKVETYADKTDARTVQKAYAFLKQAVPEDDSIQKSLDEASAEHRRLNITEITVSADLLSAANQLAEKGIDNLATPDQLKEFFDSLLDEMADSHRIYDGWSKMYTNREFQMIAKVTSHLVGKAIHDLDPFSEQGLLFALTTGTSRMRAFLHAYAFFYGRQRLMKSMCMQYETEIPEKYVLQKEKKKKRRRRRGGRGRR